MASRIYTGVSNKAKKVKSIYIGVDGKARSVKAVYIGVNGKARLCWKRPGIYKYKNNTIGLGLYRENMAGAVCDYSGYAVFGGGEAAKSDETYTSYSAIVQTCDIDLTIQEIASLSTKREYLSATTAGAAELGRSFVIFAGGAAWTSSAGSGTDAVDGYDSGVTKTSLSGLSSKKCSIGACTTANHKYAVFAGGGLLYGNASSTVDIYDRNGNRSTATNLSTASYDVKATTVGNYILFAGGKNTGNSSGYSTLTTVNAYNNSLTRTTVSSLSVGRYTHAATRAGNYALFAGGYSGKKYSTTLNTVDAYDSSLTRISAPNLTKAVAYVQSCTLDDYALIGSGMAANPSGGGVGTKIMQAYDSTLTKTNVPDMMEYRDEGGIGVELGNYAIFVSGTSMKSSDPNAIFDMYYNYIG